MWTPNNDISINNLPNEILSHILSFLDVSPPSAATSVLLEEPHFGITQADDAPLKAASCVMRRWRSAAIPFLFKHAQFRSREDPSRFPQIALLEQIRPFLQFITKHSMGKVIPTFTLIIEGLCTNTTSGEYVPDCFSTFWQALFAVIEPMVLLVVAPALSVAVLSSCNIYSLDSWTFDCECHYMRLEMPVACSKATVAKSSEVTEEPTESLVGAQDSDDMSGSIGSASAPTERTEYQSWDRPRAKSSTLFDIRNWSKFLLNEGSSVRAYATYEWWLRQPPSILADLLGAVEPGHKTFLSPSIRDFSYIGIFPLHPHFAALITHFPRIDNLYIQLVPRNDILQNSKKMKQVESEDLWMERNSCYAMLMRELFTSPPSGNFKYLKTFESGDAADVDAWNMAVEYVKRAGNGWTVAGEGIFVRDPNFKPVHGSEDDQMGLDLAPFQGALTRWAWNGVAKLPVSAYQLYIQP